MSNALELVQFVLGCTLSGFGLLLMLAGAMAGLRFPDVFARLHAASLSEIGNALTFVGLACFASNLAQSIVLLAVGFGCILFGAGSRHALAGAASALGLEEQAARLGTAEAESQR